MSTIAQNEAFRVTFWKNIWYLLNAMDWGLAVRDLEKTEELG
jgi:hypothetical protein